MTGPIRVTLSSQRAGFERINKLGPSQRKILDGIHGFTPVSRGEPACLILIAGIRLQSLQYNDARHIVLLVQRDESALRPILLSARRWRIPPKVKGAPL